MGRPGGGHKEKPFWQTTFVGVTHCGAGCTLGDIIAESKTVQTGRHVRYLVLIGYRQICIGFGKQRLSPAFAFDFQQLRRQSLELRIPIFGVTVDPGGSFGNGACL